MKHKGGRSWRLDHDPSARPLGCNGRYGGSGATLHYKRGETACDKCKASASHYKRERRRGERNPRRLKPCGTPAAAARHRVNGEPVDFACHLAEANYRTALRQQHKQR